MIIDRLIGYFSPSLAVGRAIARSQLNRLQGGGQTARYDAARRDHRTHSWRANAISPNELFAADGRRLRNVAREMVRNNAHACRAKQVIADGIVGPGVIPTIQTTDMALRKRLEALLIRMSDSTDIDFEGRLTLYGMQHLAAGTTAQDGEIFIVRHWQSMKGKGGLPFTLQLLEADMLDASVDGPLRNGNFARLGIEFDAKGRRIAYHFFEAHPSSTAFPAARLSTRRWLARDVCHIFRMDRPGQVRGFSWYAPVALPLNDFRDYMDAQLVRQRIAASFAAFVKKSITGGGSLVVDQKSKANLPLENIEAGIIEYLNEDEDIVFASPPSVDGVQDYSKVSLRMIAVGLGLDYSALTGDLSDQNFAGGRIGHLRFQRTIDAWYSSFFEPGMHVIGGWMMEAMFFLGEQPGDAQIRWSPPIHEMYDPVKETSAAEKAIQAGLSSRPHEQRRRGFDPQLLDAEIKESNDRADGFGVVFSSDARTSLAHTAVAPALPTQDDDK